MTKSTIFHGDDKEVKQPSLKKANYTKDFGEGFYRTMIKEQAQRWASRFDHGIVSTYDCIIKDDLDILEFKEMNEDWLEFIVACRSGKPHNHDIVIGAMANDQIYNYVSDYMEGILNKEQFWALAKFEYPTHQITFCTQASLQCLTYRSHEEVSV